MTEPSPVVVPLGSWNFTDIHRRPFSRALAGGKPNFAQSSINLGQTEPTRFPAGTVSLRRPFCFSPDETSSAACDY